MSGHSHSANIKHDKDKNDAKKGAAWSKIGNLITLAVKSSGGITDPAKNFKLRIALDKAREVNMPKDNVNRAIDRATGAGGQGELETVNYEGYGPGGVAVIVECITDNKNRTGAEIKNIFAQAGRNLAEPGAAAHFFQRSGFLQVSKAADQEQQILKIIDLGAEDVEEGDNQLTVLVPVDKLAEFKDKLVGEQFQILNAEIVMKPLNKITLPAGDKAKLLKFDEQLKAHEDVQKVFLNADL